MSVEMCITFKPTDIHNICTVCNGLEIHHIFGNRTSPFFAAMALVEISGENLSHDTSQIRATEITKTKINQRKK